MATLYPDGFTQRGAKAGDVWADDEGMTIEIDMICDMSPWAFVKVGSAPEERMVPKAKLAAWLMSDRTRRLSERSA